VAPEQRRWGAATVLLFRGTPSGVKLSREPNIVSLVRACAVLSSYRRARYDKTKDRAVRGLPREESVRRFVHTGFSPLSFPLGPFLLLLRLLPPLSLPFPFPLPLPRRLVRSEWRRPEVVDFSPLCSTTARGGSRRGFLDGAAIFQARVTFRVTSRWMIRIIRELPRYPISANRREGQRMFSSFSDSGSRDIEDSQYTRCVSQNR